MATLVTGAAIFVFLLSTAIAASLGRAEYKARGVIPYWDVNTTANEIEVLNVPTGGNAKLVCKAMGSPEPQLTWFRNANRLTNSSRRKLGYKYKFKFWSLLLENAIRSDSDIYTCQAKNKFGSISRNIKLNVVEVMNVRPLIVPNTPQNVTAIVGTRVEFECRVVSYLTPGIIWLFKSATSDEHSEPVQVFSDVVPKEIQDLDPEVQKYYRPQTTKFVILNVTFDQQGRYYCIAGNAHGDSKRSAFLTVLPEPTPDYSSESFEYLYKNVSLSVSPPQDNSYNNVFLSFLGVVSLFLISLCAIIIRCVKFRYMKKSSSAKNNRNILRGKVLLPIETSDGSVSIVDPLAESIKISNRRVRLNRFTGWSQLNEYAANLEIPFSYLTFAAELGSGVGGNVYKGIMTKRWRRKSTEVAIKTVNFDGSPNSAQMLNDELTMFVRIGQHDNILKLVGCCTLTEPCCLIFEYCANGDLRNYLRKFSICSSNNLIVMDQVQLAGERNEEIRDVNNEPLNAHDLIKFSLQIANGMKHIASKNCIHRDLAARNVLVTADRKIKIGDFGLAKKFSQEDYYVMDSNVMFPVRWMAPEVLQSKKFTIQNDVWAYGVVLWEIFSLGERPYREEAETSNLTDRAMQIILQNGLRLSQPRLCRNEVYEIMKLCWAANPADRPSFADIMKKFSVIIAAMSSELYLELVDEDQPLPQ